MTRREFLASVAAFPFVRYIPLDLAAPTQPTRFAVITDLHHGLAPDAYSRLEAFVQAVKRRKGLDAVMQMGDFCYSQPDSKECVDLFNTLPQPKIHVLGNHDMDKCDKDAAMKFSGQKARYYSQRVGGYRFMVLDLNHFKKDGQLHSYANGNYFTDNASCNWADPEQLEWLAKELRESKQPVVLISHQPLGFAEPGQAVPPEQMEVLRVVAEAKAANPKGAVVVSLFGHNHVDRLERCEDVPCLCVNSASYFWYEGMRPYTKPLFAFMEIDSQGMLKVSGISGEFATAPPKESDSVVGRSGSISDREIRVRR
jgi:predicted phosphodiesterase